MKNRFTKTGLMLALSSSIGACSGLETNSPINEPEGLSIHAKAYLKVYEYTEGKFPANRYRNKQGWDKFTGFFGKPTDKEEDYAELFYSSVIGEASLLSQKGVVCVNKRQAKADLVASVASELQPARTARESLQMSIVTQAPCIELKG